MRNSDESVAAEKIDRLIKELLRFLRKYWADEAFPASKVRHLLLQVAGSKSSLVLSMLLETAWKFRPSRLERISHLLNASRLDASRRYDADGLIDSEGGAGNDQDLPLWGGQAEDADLLLRRLSALRPEDKDFEHFLDNESKVRKARLQGLQARTSGLPNPAVILAPAAVERLAVPLFSGVHLFSAIEWNAWQTISNNEPLTLALETSLSGSWQKIDALLGAPIGETHACIPLLDLFGVHADGPSAELSLWYARWLFTQSVEPRELTALTGTLDSHGNVLAVDQKTFSAKVAGALAVGYARIIVPEENLQAAPEWRKLPHSVIGIRTLDQLKTLFWAGQSVPSSRRLVRLAMHGKLGPAKDDPDLDNLKFLVRGALERQDLEGEWLSLRQLLCSRPGPFNFPILRSVLQKIQEVLIDIGQQTSGFSSSSGSLGSLGSLGSDAQLGLWLEWFQSLTPPRVFFYQAPLLLRTLQRFNRQPLGLALYERLIHSLIDHDTDLTAAIAAGTLILDPSWDYPNSPWCAMEFRKSYGKLLWMLFFDPSQAVAILSRLKHRSAQEEQWLALFLEILHEVDCDAYAKIGIGSDYAETLLGPVMKWLEKTLPHFRPNPARIAPYKERLAFLWSGYRALRGIDHWSKHRKRLAEHFHAHLKAEKPDHSYDCYRCLADYQELQGILDGDNDSLNRFCQIFEKTSKATPSADALSSRKGILQNLGKAVRNELELAKPENKRRHHRPEAKTWLKCQVRFLELEKDRSSKTTLIHLLTAALQATLSGTWKSEARKSASDSANIRIKPNELCQARIMWNPVVAVADAILGEDPPPLTMVLKSLREWGGEFESHRPLVPACLCHWAGSLMQRKREPLPEPESIGSEFLLPFLTGWWETAKSAPTKLSEKWRCAVQKRMDNAIQISEAFWLLRFPESLWQMFPDTAGSLTEKWRQRSRAAQPDLDRTQIELMGSLLLRLGLTVEQLPHETPIVDCRAITCEFLRGKNVRSMVRHLVPVMQYSPQAEARMIAILDQASGECAISWFAFLYLSRLAAPTRFDRLGRFRQMVQDRRHAYPGRPVERDWWGAIQVAEACLTDDQPLVGELLTGPVTDLGAAFLALRLLKTSGQPPLAS